MAVADVCPVKAVRKPVIKWSEPWAMAAKPTGAANPYEANDANAPAPISAAPPSA